MNGICRVTNAVCVAVNGICRVTNGISPAANRVWGTAMNEPGNVWTIMHGSS